MLGTTKNISKIRLGALQLIKSVDVGSRPEHIDNRVSLGITDLFALCVIPYVTVLNHMEGTLNMLKSYLVLVSFYR